MSYTSLELFFFGFARCRARNFFRSRATFANFRRCKFSCTGLETFAVGLRRVAHDTFFRSRAKQTLVYVEPLGELSRVASCQFWFRKFRARLLTFLCARCRARNIFGSRARQTFVHAEPLGELSRVAKFLILVPKFRVHFFENFFLVCEMSRTKHFSARVQLFCKITKFIFSCMNFFFVLQTCRKGYIFSARVHKLSGSY